MAPYDDWNKPDEDEEDELQDSSIFEGQRDVVLFCIDCSSSMHETTKDSEEPYRSHVYTALEAAMQIQKRKVVVGPNDAVGILLFNTSRKNEKAARGATEYKSGTYLYQPMGQINAPTIKDLIRLLNEAKDRPDYLRYEFPPLTDTRVPMGDVFTSCNWALRDGAPKAGFKRVFLVTDEDDPHPGARSAQLVTSARTTLVDLTQAGVAVEPFFISTDEKAFDPTKFYSGVLGSSAVEADDDDDNEGLLPDSISISRIDDLLTQMRFREMPKRSLFSIPFELAEGLVIGVKGYGLVTEQKKGQYKYFMDLGDRWVPAESKTLYMDEHEQREVDRTKILYGMSLGAPSNDPDMEDEGFGTRAVPARSKVFFTADEIKSFRTLGLKPGIKLLGFKDASELAVEDNVKHSTFIYPDESAYAGSKRTVGALIKSLVKKGKIGLVRYMPRANSAPVFCAMVPQEERLDETGWMEPSGFHLIQYPFADDLRAAPVEEALRAKADAIDAAKSFIAKLQIKDGYPPDANPNPALAFHYAQLEATAFREPFEPDNFEDPTLPKIDMIHKRAGALIKAWKAVVKDDENATTQFVQATGTKRKADVSVDEMEIKSKYESGLLGKLRVDQLKEFLKSKSQPVSGKKNDLIERVASWLDKHP
ncbi:ku70-like protein [Schizopora paradoxa]|uniref:ATP-dependent DNA helicase II subunit 1 n=1 Tax=Schizopora paradoxa TaxID=27342 RepID=A0A0H2SJQ6_9AGAM|nr:ku70-like protein [Schizopora paradoxa]